MQDGDGPADIEALAVPAWHCRPRVEMEPLGVVPRHEDFYRIDGNFGGRRDLGQEPAIRSAEPKRAVRLSMDLVALLVDGPVVPATQ